MKAKPALKGPTLRDLIPSVTKLAKDMGVSPNTVYAWIENNAVPPRRAIALANALDLEIPEVLPYVRKASTPSQIIQKKQDALPLLIKVLEGSISISQAAKALSLPEHSVKITLTKWQLPELRKLKETLDQLTTGEVSLDEAASTLGITKHTIHQLRRRYGYDLPAKPAAKKEEGRYKENSRACKAAALDVISGAISARAAAAATGLSLRSLHRHIEPLLKGLGLNELAHWSHSARRALVWEITRKQRKYIESGEN